MQNPTPTVEEQKILELIYSGIEPNDFLAFEIIKNEKLAASFAMPLLVVFLTTQNDDLKRIVFEIIQPNLTKKQIAYFETKVNSTPYENEIRNEINRYLRKYVALFSEDQLMEFFFLIFRRTNFGSDLFLYFDKNKNHPARAEVFQVFIDRAISWKRLILFDLLPNEMEELLKQCFSMSEPSMYQLYIYCEDTLPLPPDFYSNEYVEIIAYHNFYDFELKEIPDFILKFKNTTLLKLQIDANVLLPEDWSKLENLEVLMFLGEGNVIDNVDFVWKLSELEVIDIGCHLLRHPEILIQFPQITFRHQNFSTDIFASTEGCNLTIEHFKIFDIANALKRLKKPLVVQKHYFKKILNLHSLHVLDSFSNKELDVLKNVEFEELRKAVEVEIKMRAVK